MSSVHAEIEPATYVFAVSAFAAGDAMTAGSNVGLLPTIGTLRPCEAAMPAIEASCLGPVVTAIAFTPARLSAATCPVMSSSVAWIFCSTTVVPFLDA